MAAAAGHPGGHKVAAPQPHRPPPIKRHHSPSPPTSTAQGPGNSVFPPGGYPPGHPFKGQTANQSQARFAPAPGQVSEQYLFRIKAPLIPFHDLGIFLHFISSL